MSHPLTPAKDVFPVAVHDLRGQPGPIDLEYARRWGRRQGRPSGLNLGVLRWGGRIDQSLADLFAYAFQNPADKGLDRTFRMCEARRPGGYEQQGDQQRFHWGELPVRVWYGVREAQFAMLLRGGAATASDVQNAVGRDAPPASADESYRRGQDGVKGLHDVLRRDRAVADEVEKSNRQVPRCHRRG